MAGDVQINPYDAFTTGEQFVTDIKSIWDQDGPYITDATARMDLAEQEIARIRDKIYPPNVDEHDGWRESIDSVRERSLKRHKSELRNNAGTVLQYMSALVDHHAAVRQFMEGPRSADFYEEIYAHPAAANAAYETTESTAVEPVLASPLRVIQGGFGLTVRPAAVTRIAKAQ